MTLIHVILVIVDEHKLVTIGKFLSMNNVIAAVRLEHTIPIRSVLGVIDPKGVEDLMHHEGDRSGTVSIQAGSTLEK